MSEGAGKNKWWVMAAVAVGVFLSTIDGSIVNVALPTLARELEAPFAAVQWVVLVYLFTVVSLLMVVGRLADIRGKKPLYVTGFIVFTFGSLGCGLSPSIGWLLAMRVVQAVGASLLMALGSAIVVDAFPPKERGRAMGIVGGLVSLGLITGPTAGGFLLAILPWQAIFLINIPLGILGTALVIRNVPHRVPKARPPFDGRGAVLFFVALLSFLVAITLGEQVGSGAVAGLLGMAVLAGVGFVRQERSFEHPLLDLRLFQSSELSVNMITGTLVFVASTGLVLLVPFFLQDLQGRSPAEAGLLLVIPPAIMGLIAPLAGWASDLVGTRPLTVLGLVVLALGYLLVSGLQLDTPAAEYALRIACLGVGMGLFVSPNNSAILGAVPRHQLGVGSGLLTLSRTVGQTTGIAVVGAAWVTIVRTLDTGLAGDAMSASHEVQRLGLVMTARGLSLVLFVAAGLTALHWFRARNRMRTGNETELPPEADARLGAEPVLAANGGTAPVPTVPLAPEPSARTAPKPSPSAAPASGSSRGPHMMTGIAPGPFMRLFREAGWMRPKMLPDVASIGLRSLQAAPLARRERQLLAPRLAKHRMDPAPVFIVGHFRSGTTHLHNLLAQNAQFAFPSTFQVFFPQVFVTAADFLKPIFARGLAPERSTDQVALAVDAPHEDEFAMGHLSRFSLYHGFYFPRRMREHFERSMSLPDQDDRATWQDLYRTFLNKVSLQGQGRPLLIKNPAHSARIEVLRELYPSARFIHIHRNPFAVHLSSMRFFRRFVDLYAFQRISDQELRENLYFLYEQLMGRLRVSLANIASGQVAHVCYEELLASPEVALGGVYKDLGLGEPMALPDAIRRQPAHRAGQHVLADDLRREVVQRCGFAFEWLGYDPQGGLDAGPQGAGPDATARPVGQADGADSLGTPGTMATP